MEKTAEEARDRKAIVRLKDGESHTVTESDYGLAEIWRKNGSLFLFSIPYMGGEPKFEKAYGLHAVDSLIEHYNSWT